MKISLSAFFASGIAVTVMTVFLYILLKKNKILSRFGVVCLYLSVLLILARGLMPLDFCGSLFENENGMLEKSVHWTRSYYSTWFLPFLMDFFQGTLFSVGSFPVTCWLILMMVWATGTVIFWVKWILGAFACKKELTKMPKMGTVGAKFVFCKVYQEIFPRKKDRCTVVSSDLFGSAAVFGIRHPIIVIPNVEYSSEELYLIFQHELYHVKHKDYLIKNICGFLAAVYWWNPIISCLFPKLVVQVQELLVDHYVIKTLGAEERLCYLECIQKTAEHALVSKRERTTMHVVGSGGRKRDVLQRFYLMMDQSVCSYTWKGIFISLIIFLLSFTFIFERSVQPEYDEYGGKVFYYVEGNSYYIRKKDGFDLYLDGKYVYTTNEIVDDFKNIPIYEGDKK